MFLCFAGGFGCRGSGCQPTETSAPPRAEETGAQAKSELAATVEGLARKLGDEDTRDDATAALTALGETAIPQLAAALGHADADARIAVLDVLEAIAGPRTTEILLTALDDSDEDVRLRAVEVLGVTRDRHAVQPLIERYAKDDDDQVRYEILTTLGLLGDPAAADLLVEETADSDRYVRMWAMDALCTMRDPRSPRLAVVLLRDPDPFVRRQVLSSCPAALDDEAGHAALIETALAAADFDEAVRARRNLQRYLAQSRDAEKLRHRIRAAALAALPGERPTNAAFLLADADDPAGIRVLIDAIGSPDHFVRHHAAYYLGRLGGPDAVTALVEALDDEQPLVAATAHDALLGLAERGDAQAKEAVARYKGPQFEQRLSAQGGAPSTQQ
jgi:HEAT repeat protein